MSKPAPSLEDLLAALPADERLILPCLQRIQQVFGYVPDGASDRVAEFLNVSRAEVIGVLTFYHDLRLSPPPPVVIGLCGAEACQAQGSRELRAGVEREFGADPERIEIRTVFCLGNCALGPAAMVNGRLIGRCDAEALTAAVSRVLEGAR